MIKYEIVWLRSDEPPRMEGKSHISGISSAIPALKSFFNTINDDNLRKLSILTTKGLYQKYKHWIEEMGKENIKVNLQLLNPFDTRVKDFRLYYGEMSAFDDTIPLIALYQNPTYDSKSWLKASYEIANFMRDSGFYATIDVEIDAEIKYTITQGEKELSVDQGRRKVVLSFVSPYYEDNSHFNIAYMQAVETVAPGYFPNGQVPEMLIEPKFTWKICDTDYLIQSDLERELRALIEPSFFTE
ncbi:hypothetical protein AX774_g1538 [Zancudomyces culisetae]|uniref:Uncharacterized protein n=1 Tax=Zancudomyces culisetae TaxID=1213189 RepID=A0A1R1PVD2_ZANCU|nr:hypothetical protein AX774_g1538 [Zancudomyces culisetae]|eukprot:OMH84925.1 hypothetical protein AX774_g1538 [Zancudomyces culisetae]